MRTATQQAGIVTLFKPGGKYYTQEVWRVPEIVHDWSERRGAFDRPAMVPADMAQSPDFHQIDGGPVLVEDPWGYPHLLLTPPAVIIEDVGILPTGNLEPVPQPDKVERLARRVVAYLGKQGKPVGVSRVRCDLKPGSASAWDAALAHAIDNEWVVTGPGRKAGSTVLKLGSETPDET